MEHSRYLCKGCDVTFMDQFDYLPEQKGITADAENYIISRLGVQTFTETAAELGVCVQTVANRAREFGTAERELQLKGRYRYLSMDEVFITRDQEGESVYYWLLNDKTACPGNPTTYGQTRGAIKRMLPGGFQNWHTRKVWRL